MHISQVSWRVPVFMETQEVYLTRQGKPKLGGKKKQRLLIRNQHAQIDGGVRHEQY